jgi:hypothetical protein
MTIFNLSKYIKLKGVILGNEKRNILLVMLLLFFSIFGCTTNAVPFTPSQFINNLTDFNFFGWNIGDFNGLILYIDGNKISGTDIGSLISLGIIGNIDGGFANSNYLNSQNFDGGFSNSEYTSGQYIDGGNALGK